jgi:predicted transcriptional regulator
MAKPATISQPETAEEARRHGGVEQGLVSLNAGRSVAYATVREWLLSWGTKDEQRPPECP